MTRARALLSRHVLLLLLLLLPGVCVARPAGGSSPPSSRPTDLSVPPELANTPTVATDDGALASKASTEPATLGVEQGADASPSAPVPVVERRRRPVVNSAVASKKRRTASTTKGKQRKKRKKGAAAAAPSPTMMGSLNEGFSKLYGSANEYVHSIGSSVKDAIAQRDAARREAAERGRSAEYEDDEDGEDDEQDDEERYARRRAAAAEEEEEEGETVEITMSERGAMIGSLLLSSAGVPGIIVGGAFGGAAGYVTERIEQARSYVASAYGERVATERQIKEQMAAANSELKALDDVRVLSADADEAAELTAQLAAFLAMPCNKRCADCAARLRHPNDAWASVNLGVLVCVNCAAVHRSLGVGVSRVKSPVFDRWDAAAARALLAPGGNQAARDLYLARLPTGYAEPSATSDAERRAKFIRTKYVRLRWAEPGFRDARRAQLAERAAEQDAAEAARRSAARPASRKGKPSRATPMPSLSSEG